MLFLPISEKRPSRGTGPPEWKQPQISVSLQAGGLVYSIFNQVSITDTVSVISIFRY